MESLGFKDHQGPPDHLDPMVSFTALKEEKERQDLLGLLVSLGLVDRKDGKVMMETANARISSSGVFRGYQDPRASQASMGSQGRKGAKETLASTASLDSQGSRELPVTLGLLDPKD